MIRKYIDFDIAINYDTKDPIIINNLNFDLLLKVLKSKTFLESDSISISYKFMGGSKYLFEKTDIWNKIKTKSKNILKGKPFDWLTILSHSSSWIFLERFYPYTDASFEKAFKEWNNPYGNSRQRLDYKQFIDLVVIYSAFIHPIYSRHSLGIHGTITQENDHSDDSALKSYKEEIIDKLETLFKRIDFYLNLLTEE